MFQESTMNRISAPILILAASLISGCAAKYVTPGGAANLSDIDRADIKELAARKPSPSFPARIASVRVQAPSYRSHTTDGIGVGSYSVITVRELLTEEHLQSVSSWPSVAGLAPINRLLLPPKLESLEDLRLAAAKVQADVLLVYTLDTSFRVQGKFYSPLSIVSLGLVPDREARVVATASALFVDVRTGFVYGLAESTAKEAQLTNAWSSTSTVDAQRLKAEKQAFGQLVQALGEVWQGVVARYDSETET